MPTCKTHGTAQKKQTKGEPSTGCPQALLGPGGYAPVSIRSDTTREKGNGPVPFPNPAGARAELTQPAQSLRDAARARGRRGRPGLGQGPSPRGRVARGEPGTPWAAGGCASLLRLHRRPPASSGESGCGVLEDGDCRGPRPPSRGRARRLPELSVVLTRPAHCPRGWRGRVTPVRPGESSLSRPPRGLPRSLAYGQPCDSLTDCSALSAQPASAFPAGAGISRCLRLREPVPFVWQ